MRSRLYRDTIGLDVVDAELYDGRAPIEPGDLAPLLLAVLAAPANVDVSRLEVFPTAQAIAGTRLHRSDTEAGSVPSHPKKC